jgi:hypothetical protein
MKTKLAIAAALAAVLTSPALAAPPKHRAPVSHDTMNAYGAATPYSSRGDVVMFGSRVVGEDPDPNIRSQMQHDPAVSEY